MFKIKLRQIFNSIKLLKYNPYFGFIKPPAHIFKKYEQVVILCPDKKKIRICFLKYGRCFENPFLIEITECSSKAHGLR